MSNNSRLCVSSMPPQANEETLKIIFEEQTGVSPKNIILRTDHALVDLPDNLTAEKAIELVNGFEVMGSQLLVEASAVRRSRGRVVQVSNIPEVCTWDDFTRFVSNFGGFQHIEKGTLKSNGYSAIITYENTSEAQQVQSQLNSHEIEPGVFLKADSLMDRGGRGGATRGGTFRNDFPLRILVLSDMVGAIIGRAGGTIRQITQQSRARVDVHRKENAGSPEKVITIFGNPENCSNACQKILDIMQQESNATNRGEVPLKLLAHNGLVGRIIGRNGSTIKRIMEQSDTKVTVSSNIHDFSSWNLERVITVKGNLENVARAERMLSQKLRQSYENDLAAMAAQTYLYPGVHPMAMMATQPPHAGPPTPPYGPPQVYPPQAPPSHAPPELQKETVFVHVPDSSVGALIGTGGCSIRDMMSCSGASIKVIQPGGKEEPTERKVCVVGTPEAQWKAQFMIFKKVGSEGFRGPQEATLKVEISVPTRQVGRIIGKGGSTVRELQRVTHALVKFPEDARNSEAEETAVHIVGDFFCSMAAQRQIRSLVFKSGGPRRPSSSPH